MKNLLAAHLLKDLDETDSINAALFSVAFGELDVLRKKIEEIPASIDNSAQNIEFSTTRATDEFIGTANIALAKFKRRTLDLQALVDRIEQSETIQLPTQQLQSKPITTGLPIWMGPTLFFAGLVVGGVLAGLILH